MSDNNVDVKKKEKKIWDASVCFTFFGTWVDTIQTIKETPGIDGNKFALELFEAIAMYSMYDQEPVFSNPLLQWPWAEIKRSIDNSIEKRRRNFADEERNGTHEAIVALAVEKPYLSTRELGKELGIGKSTVDRVLKKEQYQEKVKAARKAYNQEQLKSNTYAEVMGIEEHPDNSSFGIDNFVDISIENDTDTDIVSVDGFESGDVSDNTSEDDIVIEIDSDTANGTVTVTDNVTGTDTVTGTGNGTVTMGRDSGTVDGTDDFQVSPEFIQKEKENERDMILSILDNEFGHNPDELYKEISRAERYSEKESCYYTTTSSYLDIFIQKLKNIYNTLRKRREDNQMFERHKYNRLLGRTLPSKCEKFSIDMKGIVKDIKVFSVLEKVKETMPYDTRYGIWLNGWDIEKEEPKVTVAMGLLPEAVIMKQRHVLDGIPEDYIRDAIVKYRDKADASLHYMY